SQFDSSLLTVTADGVDALFFTREALAVNDFNGTLMKLYDARENGGFFVVPPLPECKASDECHGPGSQAAPPAAIATLELERGNQPGAKPGCDAVHLSDRAVRLASRAGALRRRAAHVHGTNAAQLRKRAAQLSRKAGQARHASKACRRQSRRIK